MVQHPAEAQVYSITKPSSAAGKCLHIRLQLRSAGPSTWLIVLAAGTLGATGLPSTTAAATTELLKGSSCRREAACWWLRGTACCSVSRVKETRLDSRVQSRSRESSLVSSLALSLVSSLPLSLAMAMLLYTGEQNSNMDLSYCTAL